MRSTLDGGYPLRRIHAVRHTCPVPNSEAHSHGTGFGRPGSDGYADAVYPEADSDGGYPGAYIRASAYPDGYADAHGGSHPNACAHRNSRPCLPTGAHGECDPGTPSI